MKRSKKGVSARNAILVKLRVSAGRREELFGTVDAHGHSLNNARATLSQLKRARLIHENNDGIRLLAPGTRAADEILSGGANQNSRTAGNSVALRKQLCLGKMSL